MLAAEKIDRATTLAEYMEKEYGVTPQNIDEKLKEMKSIFYERRTSNGGSKRVQCINRGSTAVAYQNQ